MGKDPTMKDVAKEAGVALGTVSKVFNNIPVGDEYRVKVEEAAKKLGYKVNNYARGLKTSKTNIIALILPSVIHPFFGSIAEYCSRELKARGYNMYLFTTDYDPEVEKRCIDMAQNNMVDGIICLSYNPNLAIPEGLPFVSIDRYYNSSVPCVSSDNFGGGQLAARKLAEFGCRKLLALQDASSIPGEVDKRPLGFESYCKMNNLDCDVLVLYDQGFSPFYEYLDNHIQDGRLNYDGIFCDNDHMAYSMIRHLRSVGIRVPEDVQVIGFDGLKRFGFADYYCSTIVQPVKEIARVCVDIVLQEDRSRLSPLMCLPISYVSGGTTKG